MKFDDQLMHGLPWTGEDLSGWWASEKFDGHRAVWLNGRLYSRTGRDLEPPPWFTEALPKFNLDCELTAPGGNHCSVTAALRRYDWNALELRPFDVISPRILFETALEILELLPTRSFFYPVEYKPCLSTEWARGFFRAVKCRKGEGLMLRRTSSEYVPARVDWLLKMK